MPINAQTLPDGQVTGQYLVAVNSAGFITRIAASTFSGAGIFNGEGDPPLVHPLGADYTLVEGHYYIQKDGANREVFEYQADDTWLSLGNLLGGRVHTANSLGTDIYENETGVVLNLEHFGLDDYYFNETQMKVFGPATLDVGIDFGVEDRTNWFTRREAQELQFFDSVNVGEATQAVKQSFDWNPGLIVDPLDPAYAPQSNDTYYQDVTATSTTHGGWRYSWNEADYLASIVAGDTYAQALSIGWVGADAANPRRVFARSPITHQSEVVPEMNDNDYITGDGYFNQATGNLYASYVSGVVPADPVDLDADRAAAWGTPTSLVGRDIITIETEPETDDSLFIEGDFVISIVDNTRVIYGPYISGQDNRVDSWGLATNPGRPMRGPVVHVVNTTDTAYALPTTYVDQQHITPAWEGEPEIINKVVNGDTILVRYWEDDGGMALTGKEAVAGPYVTTSINRIEGDAEENLLTGSWGTLRNRNPTRMHDVGVYEQHDIRYSAGDYLRYLDGIYGPYVIGAADVNAAWPLAINAAGANTYYSTLPADDATNVVTTNFNPVVQADDFLEVSFDMGATNYPAKVYRYGPAVITNTTEVDWGDTPINLSGTRFLSSADRVIDDILFADGDYLDVDGILYGPYVEGAADLDTAWPYHRHLRGAVTFSVNDTANIPYNAWPTNYNAGLFNDAIPKVGDAVEVVRTGYSEYREITNVNYATQAITLDVVSTYNRAPTTTVVNTTAYPARDDAVYMPGDIVSINHGYQFGPYVQGQATDLLALPLLSSPNNGSHNVVLADNAAEPEVNPLHADYTGVAILKHGDIVTGTITGGEKRKQWIAVSPDPNGYTVDDFTFTGPINPDVVREFPTTGPGQPARNDNLYWAGSFILNDGNDRYGPYVEGQATNELAWPPQSLGAGSVQITQTGTGDVFEMTLDADNNIVFTEV